MMHRYLHNSTLKIMEKEAITPQVEEIPGEVAQLKELVNVLLSKDKEREKEIKELNRKMTESAFQHARDMETIKGLQSFLNLHIQAKKDEIEGNGMEPERDSLDPPSPISTGQSSSSCSSQGDSAEVVSDDSRTKSKIKNEIKESTSESDVLSGDTAPSNVLKVRDIPPDFCEKETLRNHFSQYGNIKLMRVIPESCSAHIAFDTKDSALKAKDATSIDDESPPMSIFYGQVQQTTATKRLISKHLKDKAMLDNVKKCKNFLSTLIKVTHSQPAETVKNVQALIQGLIDGRVEPEAFTERLQHELQSSPQPYLVPFLKRSLPLVRQCMQQGRMTIEGVNPPPVGGASLAVIGPRKKRKFDLGDSTTSESTNCMVTVTIELGHQANLLKEQRLCGWTHDWTVFVRGFEENEIQHFVEKVVFKLHKTYTTPTRVISEPPYKVTECGYAGFYLPIEIHFKNKQTPRKIPFAYDMFLNASDTPPINNIRYEKLKFRNPTPEFKARLIRAGGIEQGLDGLPVQHPVPELEGSPPKNVIERKSSTGSDVQASTSNTSRIMRPRIKRVN